MSNDALQQRLAVYAAEAARTCTALGQQQPDPHVLRHTAAMGLPVGNDIAVIALWLGHENVTTPQIYQRASRHGPQAASPRPDHAAATPPCLYQPPDQLLAFLEAL
jgi:site-specific recombinase XerD